MPADSTVHVQRRTLAELNSDSSSGHVLAKIGVPAVGAAVGEIAGGGTPHEVRLLLRLLEAAHVRANARGPATVVDRVDADVGRIHRLHRRAGHVVCRGQEIGRASCRERV